jgi:hypothetical protein
MSDCKGGGPGPEAKKGPVVADRALEVLGEDA